MKRTDEISINWQIWKWERTAMALYNCGEKRLVKEFGKKFDAQFYNEKAMSAIGNVPEGK